MSKVTKRVRDGKVTWLARWRDPDGRQRKKSFTRRVDADRFITALPAEMLRGTYVDPDAGRVLVAEHAAQWVAGRPHRPSAAEHQARLLRNHPAPLPLGQMRMANVRTSHVQAWASDRARVLQPSTTKVLVTLVRSVFAAAVVDRVIGVSPVQRIPFPRHEAARVVPLLVEQVRMLAATVPARCSAMVVTQSGLGLRVGELLGLQVQDVDFLGRVVHVRHQLSRDTKSLQPCKTPRSVRDIPLPQTVADALAAHMSVFPPRGGFVFTAPLGRPWWQMRYGRVFGAAVRAAGLPEGTTTHDLRHHYASVLLAAGESVVAVAERLGHENASLVLTTYGHLMADSEVRTRRAIDAAWSAPDVPREVEQAR